MSEEEDVPNGEFEDDTNIDLLIEKLDSQRVFAAKALGRLKDRRAVDALIAALRKEETKRNEPFKESVIEALVRIGDKKAIEPLMEVYTSSSRKMRDRIITALQALGASDSDIEKLYAKERMKAGSSYQISKHNLLVVSAVIASLLCFIAGIWMLSIKGGGETPTIFESAFHATGLYFIAKGFFLGPALYTMGKKRS